MRAARESAQSHHESVIEATRAPHPAPPLWQGIVPLFATTLFAASLLMFAVEPVVAKTVLPILGGTPMVWNTCVLFFQIVLLAGYAYAHGVTTWLGSRRAAATYVVLLLLPLATLPFAIGPNAEPPTGSSPIGWLLVVLAKSIGLPFLALAATAPFLQRQFADTSHTHAADPYFLYAASNCGSLLALVMYPVLIEPTLPLRVQNRLWAIGYGAFVLVACSSIATGWRYSRRGAASGRSIRTGTAPIATPTNRRRAVWVVLAFIPSSLMLAVTTYFSTDMAPMPLLWIAPLALYLLTFIVAFSARSTAARSIADRLMPLLVLPLVITLTAGLEISLSVAIPMHLAAFSAAALVCHGRLAAERPDSAHLTEFYFWIAFGGMLGGVFNTLAAPLLFSRVIEYPLVLVLALAARRSGNGEKRRALFSRHDVVIPGGVAALSAAFMLWLHHASPQMRVAGLAAPAFIAFTQARVSARFSACVAAMLIAGSLAASAPKDTLYVSRTFFGVYRVIADQENSRRHALLHGTTLHGMQVLDSSRQDEPVTYYHRDGPIGQAFAALPGFDAAPSIAVVGLGVGTLASYRAQGQQWTFYEIDPEVERIARNDAYFTFLRRCGDACRVVLGDARLSMVRAAPHEYGFIVLDAFSSDAIPIHLLTAEAMALYVSRLAPGGAIAFHISNRHLDLAPVLAKVAVGHGLVVRQQRHSVDQAVANGAWSSEWMIMARTVADLGPLATDRRWIVPAVSPTTPLWTDDFSNILSVVSLNRR